MNMPPEVEKIKILFFIGTLRAGGKERRLIELLTYLKSKGLYEMEIVFTSYEIHYPDFFSLGIPFEVIKKEFSKNDPTVIYKFYNICKRKKPHIIHSWGKVQSFYTLPTIIFQHISLINSQITSAPPDTSKFSLENMVNQLIFHFSTVVLANSKAGIRAFYPPSNKSRLIYNGINLNRFENLPDKLQVKAKYSLNTPFVVVMIASISPKKDYSMFYRVASKVMARRTDVSFIGAGAYFPHDPEFKKITDLTQNNPNMHFVGRINDVEALVNCCDIGMLFSPFGEGISNTLLEYMALGKPVIANKIGGNTEIITNNQNGYLVENESEEDISKLIIDLIDDEEKRERFGAFSKQFIRDKFTIEKMGQAFEQVYQQCSAERGTKIEPRKMSMSK